MVRDFIQAAEAYPKNPRYGMRMREIMEIMDYCGDSRTELVFTAFYVGYMQGHKAAAAEARRAAGEH